MSRRIPLPPSLGPSFSTAAARDQGVTPSRLRACDLERPFHSVRALRPEGELGAEEAILRRAVQYSHRMTEHEFFSHVTAAVIWGIPLPFGALSGGCIDAGVFSPRRNPESREVKGHEVHPRLANVQIHPVTGLRVTTPASTWAMLGGVLLDRYDLVAAGDAVVRRQMHPADPPPLATLDQLQASIDAGRRRGVVALREALPYVRSGSSSRPETWLRLTLVDGRLDEPIANFEVWQDGVWLARVDLGYPEEKVAVEYEGLQHLVDERQWARDIARYERLAHAGWRVVRVTYDDLLANRRDLVARVRAALRS